MTPVKYSPQPPEFRPGPQPAPRNTLAARPGLQAEIEMLRIIIQRVFGAANASELEIEEWTSVLTALASASTRLAGLLKAQQSLSGADETRAALSRALAQVVREMELR